MPTHELLTRGQTAAELGVSASTVDRRARAGQGIRRLQVGGRPRYLIEPAAATADLAAATLLRLLEDGRADKTRQLDAAHLEKMRLTDVLERHAQSYGSTIDRLSQRLVELSRLVERGGQTAERA